MQKPRKFEGDLIVVATHNKGKLRELRSYLEPLGITLKSADDFNLPEPAETETTYVGNAALKARAAAEACGQICLADDSGLAVDALDGDPGIYSARWAEDAEGNRDFLRAMALIHQKLGTTKNRKAKFVCSIALCWPDGHVETVEGYAHGQVIWPPRGPDGFGYDPMFLPDGHDQTFGEMDAQQKGQISHRRNAIEKILDKCFR